MLVVSVYKKDKECEGAATRIDLCCCCCCILKLQSSEQTNNKAANLSIRMLGIWEQINEAETKCIIVLTVQIKKGKDCDLS